MLNKTKIALAAALILGSASAVLAADSGENNLGGTPMPGGVGVNPADHRNNPAVQAAPRSQENSIRTEGRGSAEGLREQTERPLKDPQDPGPDTNK